MKAAIIIVALLCAGCERSPDQRTKNDRDAYDPIVYRDRKTGCEYLTTAQIKALTPRMGADGKQICGAKP